MFLGQAFRWNKVDVLLNFRRDRVPIQLKWRELPLTHLAFDLWPEFHRILIAICINIDNVACRGHGQCEVELIEPSSNPF